jgi:2-keto-4-pentenoate hydratase/2-oxohepta-3-ene-1,7-dioic acid hydratase in catechol pathway
VKLGILETREQSLLACEQRGQVINLWGCGPWNTISEVIRDWDAARGVLAEACGESWRVMHQPYRWLPPIPRPPKFLLLAGNFRAHVVESGFTPAPDENLTPQFFMKPSTAIIGAEDPIPLSSRNVALDYEAELGVVIGHPLKNCSPAEAQAAVWGYTVVNDVSERRLNAKWPHRKIRQNDEFFDWLTGKWFDGSAPVGPWVVTADEIADPRELIIRAFLNGEKVQEAPASAMIHSIPDALSYISQIVSLEPGDLIAMGTPSGVGMARNRLLQAGDRIACEVEGIGRITNLVAS